MNTITLDIESTGLSWQSDSILLCGYSIDGGEIKYGISDELKEALSKAENVLRGHNCKFDALFLSSAGCDVSCQLEDTRILAYLNWPNEESHSLKHLVRTKLHGKPTELSDIQFKPLKKDLLYLSLDEYFTFSDGKMVRKDLLTQYHREDILNVDRLYKRLSVTDWFRDVEMPLTRILFEMELYGCPLDASTIRTLGGTLSTSRDGSLQRLRGKVEALRGQALVGLVQAKEEGKEEEFNPGSSQQVREVLKALGHNLEELCEKTPKGEYCVDKALLKSLAWKGDEFSKVLLDYRKFSKILSTYVEPFVEGIKKDGNLHGSINQAGSEDQYGEGTKGTNTGRLSSSSPNLQNIPSRTKEGKEVRKAFVASKDGFMFDTDLKQIEPRLIAHYSQAPKLLNAYRSGLDTHGLFACDIFDRPDINTLVGPERFIGKTSWLATVYGCSYKKLLRICENFSDEPLVLDLEPYRNVFDGLENKQKKQVMDACGKDYRTVHAQWMFFKNVQDKFKEKNPEIFAWRQQHIDRTRLIGYVVTLGGRKIQVDGLGSYSFKERAEAERRAINYLIQGSAADIFKRIMIEFNKKVVVKGLGRMFAVIHDELLGEIFDPKYIGLVKDIMENTCKLRNVSIEADTRLCASWADK